LILTNGNKTRQLNKSGKKTKQTKSDKKTYPISWQQMGDDINGEAKDDLSGLSVSLASDGDTVAIGAPFNDGNGTYSGHVRVYSVCAV